MKRRIKAFTITELLVVLLISTLVVACMLQLLTLTNAHTVSTLRKQDGEREIAQCLLFLSRNMRNAETVSCEDGSLSFTYPHTHNRSLTFDPNVVMEQALLHDTLSVKLTLVDTASVKNGNLYFLTACIATKQKQYNASLYKQYNRDYLINQVQRHEHFSEPATEAR